MTGKATSICLKRVLVIVLALIMMITFIPVFGGGQAHAASSFSAIPYNYQSMYQAYSNNFEFSIGSNWGYGYDLYMEYRPLGGKWRTSGYMDSPYATYVIKGLAPNTVYQTRLYFKTYSGTKGRYSRIISIKTGPNAKPAIKSCKVKAVKVKKHKARVYGYYTGLYLGSYKYYTFKLKTTVKFKKAPRTPGFAIKLPTLGYLKKYKGTKKKYVHTTGTLRRNYSKPRGLRVTVQAFTFRSYAYGGYSQLYSKSCKIK